MINKTNMSSLSGSSDALNERAEFLAYLCRIAYELRSVQAGLSLFIETCAGLSEQDRDTLSDSVTNITRLSNDLLSKGNSNQSVPNKNIAYTLVSVVAAEVLNKKRAQYKQVNFNWYELGIGGSSFVFTKIDPRDFDFFISSIIDRSVKASGNKGDIGLQVGSNRDHVWFTVTSYGKKIPPEAVGDINSAFDDGDFVRIHKILQNNGKVFIESTEERTRVTLEFPIVDCPDWMAKYITLHDGDTLVVLSDDASIHNEWDLCFKTENVTIKHYTSDAEAIAFIENFTPKNRLFFLADFDLINKESKGLQILWQTLMQGQSIFMTSGYSDQGILEFAHKVGVQILPKQLIEKIPYKIIPTEREVMTPIQADMVIIDDSKIFADTLTQYIKKQHAAVQTYYNPYDFLKDLSRYTKNIKIIIDNSLGANITGLEIAKQLHASEYNNIYLITGNSFAPGEIPDYITLIPKGDMDALNQII